jgi:YidC/Oxa1 family membrane protein insertase
MISYLFNEIFYRPLFNGLIFLYNIIPAADMGLAIIALTILIRLILWPLNGKSIKNQRILARLQPKMEEVKKKYKDDKEAQAKALMQLYSDNKINPLAGFLPLLIQIPIIIALWRVFLNSAKADLSALYPFIMAPAALHSSFLGILDLTQRSVVLAIVSGALQYLQTRMIMPKMKGGGSDFSRIMSQQMLYFGPVISVIIFLSLPAALPLYWTVVTLMTMLQQYLSQKNERELGEN